MTFLSYQMCHDKQRFFNTSNVLAEFLRPSAPHRIESRSLKCIRRRVFEQQKWCRKSPIDGSQK